MNEAVLSLGSNLGNRGYNIGVAVKALALLPKTTVADISPLFETEPVEVPDEQNSYINCCVKLHTELQAHTLLGACLGIEAAMSRRRPYKNSPRSIDIDLLLYGSGTKVCNTRDLSLPHPRMFERAFVLVPLKYLYPDGIALGIDFNDVYKDIDKSGVELIGDSRIN